MDYECKRIELSQIDGADSTFRISTGGVTDRLKASIRNIGLIHPPLVLPKPVQNSKKEQFIIVSGFARVEACRQLGWHLFNAYCLRADTAFYHCALMAIADNLQRSLNLVEMARAFALVEKTGTHREEAHRVLIAIGMQPNDELVAKLQKVAGMSDRLQQGLIEGTIALPTAIELCEMDDGPGAMALTELFGQLQLSLNRQREILDWIQAIVHREKTTVSEVLADAVIGHELDDDACDRPRAANQIRHHLKRRRYPEMIAHEQQYAQAVKGLKVPKGIQLIPPPHFEHPTYSLRVDFSTIKDLSEKLKKAHRLTESPALASLLEPPSFEK